MSPQDWPLVSVVIPAYNCADYIAPCLDSILAQDYPHLEILVVDDGSSDDTPARVQAYGAPVRYLRQANSGSAVARNLGIESAQGELIAFCDSDDLWAPARLKQQVAFLLGQQQYQAVCGRFKAVPDHYTMADAARESYEAEARLDPDKSGWTYLRVLESSIYHLDTLLVRREALATVRFNKDYRRGQDFDFWLQLLHVTPIAQLHNLYGFYRQSAISITRKPHVRNYRAEILEAALKRYGRRDQNGAEISQQALDRLFSISWFGHGWELYQARWFRRAAESFAKVLRHQPGHWGARKLRLFCQLRSFQDQGPADAVRH
jgi:glycosyltransferase involved in cell wall biosynthesis